MIMFINIKYNYLREGSFMKHNHNDSIACTVGECKFHCTTDDYCTLDKIQVAKHEPVASTVECTDCNSFQKR